MSEENIKNVTLTALEENIAALEKELEDMSEDSSSEEEKNEEEERPTKKQKTSIAHASIGGGEKILCETCNVYVVGEDKMIEHKEGRKHKEKTRENLKTTYEAAAHQPFYCRYCYITAENEEDFFKHRNSSEHKDKKNEHDRATFCVLCSKQFTSIIQLEEHEKGKWHVMRTTKKEEMKSNNREGGGGGGGVGEKQKGGRQRPCIAFQKGECKRGTMCIFLHGRIFKDQSGGKGGEGKGNIKY